VEVTSESGKQDQVLSRQGAGGKEKEADLKLYEKRILSPLPRIKPTFLDKIDINFATTLT